MKIALRPDNQRQYRNPLRDSPKFVYLAVACDEVDRNFVILQAAILESNVHVLYCTKMAQPWSLLRDRFPQIAYC
jgi:hypothetical protein